MHLLFLCSLQLPFRLEEVGFGFLQEYENTYESDKSDYPYAVENYYNAISIPRDYSVRRRGLRPIHSTDHHIEIFSLRTIELHLRCEVVPIHRARLRLLQRCWNGNHFGHSDEEKADFELISNEVANLTDFCTHPAAMAWIRARFFADEETSLFSSRVHVCSAASSELSFFARDSCSVS